MASLNNGAALIFTLLLGLIALPAGFVLGIVFSRCHIKPILKRLEDLETYFLPRKRVEFNDEFDHSGHIVLAPSPFEEQFHAMGSQASRGAVLVKHRVMTEVAMKDPALRKELVELRERGDGKWLGVYIDRIYSNPARAKELQEIHNRYAAKGWNLVGIEPAYDTAEGVCVWLELEKRIQVLNPDRNAAQTVASGVERSA